MRFPFLNDPATGKPDELVTIAVVTTLAAVTRFLLDGVTVNLDGYIFTFGHIDASVYLAILAPALGAHGYIKGKDQTK